MRTRQSQVGSAGGETNVVSERLSSLATDCMVCAETSAPSAKTARGFPPKGRLVKTSTRRYRSRRISCQSELFAIHDETGALCKSVVELHRRDVGFMGLPVDAG